MYIYHQSTPSLNFFWNRPILMKGSRKCLTCMFPTSLPRSDLVSSLIQPRCTLHSHYLSLLNGKPHLGENGAMEECLNLATIPHCHKNIPGDRRHYLLPSCSCSQYRSPDLFETSISNVCLSTAQSVLLETIDRQLLLGLTYFVCQVPPSPPPTHYGPSTNNFLTFEFLMRICLLRKGVGVQESLLRKS